MSEPIRMPTFITSTGEDHPDEWPVEGWAVARLVASEWAPPATAVKVAIALALFGALAWANTHEWSSGGTPVAAAPEPAGAVQTGTVPAGPVQR